MRSAPDEADRLMGRARATAVIGVAQIRQLCIVEDCLNLLLDPIMLPAQLVEVDLLLARGLMFDVDGAKHHRLGVLHERASTMLSMLKPSALADLA